MSEPTAYTVTVWRADQHETDQPLWKCLWQGYGCSASVVREALQGMPYPVTCDLNITVRRRL